MSWALRIKNPALKSLRKIAEKDKKRIILALEEMEHAPFAGDIKMLRGDDKVYRRRVGPWRIFFEIDGRYAVVQAITRRSTTTYKK